MRASEKSSNKNQRHKKATNSCQFIVKLVEMMKQYPNNVNWSEDGQQICFRNLQVIQNKVIPSYFRHRNMLSFVRQLNMYYFSKVESDDENMMRFKHHIFKKGNQDNFHQISRRNKSRDQIIGNLQKNYSQTLQIIQTQSKISQETKSLLRIGVEYHLIALKNLKKIKGAMQQLSEHMKSVRSAQIKNSLVKLKNENMPQINCLIQQQKNLQVFVRDQLCRDLIVMPIASNSMPSNQPLPCIQSQLLLLEDQYRTIKDVQAIRFGFNMHSDYSLLNFKSECSLEKNLKQGLEDDLDKNQDVSLEQDIQN